MPARRETRTAFGSVTRAHPWTFLDKYTLLHRWCRSWTIDQQTLAFLHSALHGLQCVEMQVRQSTATLLLQFLLWCLSIQKSRQAAMSRSNSETFPDLNVGASDFISGGTTTRFGTLHNKASGKYVRIVDRSHIDAKAEEEDPDALLILRTISFNEMVIQGNSSKYYLCVNSKGEFVARKRRKERGIVCSFSETLSHKRYNEYHVFQHPGWLLGFKGNGEQRKAQRNKPDHKSALFFFYQAETDDRIRKDENRFNELFEEVVREDEALRNREKRLRKFTEPSRRSIEDSHR